MSERKETGKQGAKEKSSAGTSTSATSEAEAVPAAAMTGDMAPGPEMTAVAGTAYDSSATRPHAAEGAMGYGAEMPGDGRGEGLRESAREDVREIVDRTRGVASQLGADMRGAAEQLIEDQKARAADSVRNLAGALHRTAESLEHDNPSIAEFTDRMAERIDSASMRFRERRFSDLLADTEDFAHRRPALFIAGAVAVGFALGRMMVASPARPYERPYEGAD